MKTTLSFGLIVAAASTLLACSSDEGATREPEGGAGQTSGGAAGQTGGGAGGGSSGAAGTPSGGAGGGTGSTLNLGAPLTITSSAADEATVVGAPAINGGVILAQSPVMAVTATENHRNGALCMKGTTEVVPNATSYGTHWGAELSVDLNLVATGATVADAGADGGDAGPVLGTAPQPWPYSNVIGFAFKVEGQDTASPTGGLPGAMRFKGVPTGANTETDTYCNQVAGGPMALTLTSGATQEILFSEISFQCWAMGNATLMDDPIPVGVPAGGSRPNPKALTSISWQVPSDIAPTPQYPFDFCITDIRPILAP